MTLQIEFLPAEARTVLVAANPSAGARSGKPAVEQLVDELHKAGFEASIHSDIERLEEVAAREQAAGKLRAVVAAGGDGTVGLVVNRTPVGVPVSILPLGTENLLSKYLCLSADPAAVCETIRQGATIRLDAGRVKNRLFLLMASCGFDADVVRRLHDERQGHIHHLSYAKPILDSIRSYEYPPLRVYCDGNETEAGGASPADQPIVARWAFVMNLPRYAGGLQIVPHAEGTDGLLDVCTFKEGSLWSGLRYLAGVLVGQHQSLSDCTNLRTRRVRIESDGEVPYQLDGDPGGFLPLEIEIVPQRLTMLASVDWAQANGFALPSPA